MTSPFATYEEFYEAEGPIYTFANSPAIIGLLVIASALVFVYFIYSTYTIKKGQSEAKSPIILSVLIATSLVSMADALYTNHVKHNRPTASVTPTEQRNSFQPLAMLGLVGGGVASRRRQLRRQPRRSGVLRQRKVR
jgi:hypothetical protein